MRLLAAGVFSRRAGLPAPPIKSPREARTDAQIHSQHVFLLADK